MGIRLVIIDYCLLHARQALEIETTLDHLPKAAFVEVPGCGLVVFGDSIPAVGVGPPHYCRAAPVSYATLCLQNFALCSPQVLKNHLEHMVIKAQSWWVRPTRAVCGMWMRFTHDQDL